MRNRLKIGAGLSAFIVTVALIAVATLPGLAQREARPHDEVAALEIMARINEFRLERGLVSLSRGLSKIGQVFNMCSADAQGGVRKRCLIIEYVLLTRHRLQRQIVQNLDGMFQIVFRNDK